MHSLKSIIGLAAFITLASAHASLVAQTPASQPQPVDGDAQRLTFLGDQLSADEAAIKAVNKALILDGYKAAMDADHAADAAKGNEIMDRNGGGPVAWRDFYGRSAKSFIMHDPYGAYHQVGRPRQFNYVYRANNNQIQAAKSDISSIAKQVDQLLQRRQKLETDQSLLWATLSFEAIANRDIKTRSLYRNQLQVTPPANSPQDVARVAALRAAVLYLRTLSNATSVLGERLEVDQTGVYDKLRDTLGAAADQLEEASANFTDVPGIVPSEVQQYAAMVNDAKKIQSICKNICDAQAGIAKTAIGGEGEEQRKVLFRGTLQNALLSLPESAGSLDDEVTAAAAAWHIAGTPGVKNTDQPLDPYENTPPAAKPLVTSNGPTPSSPTPIPPAEVDSGKAIDLLKTFDLKSGVRRGSWALKDGKLSVDSPNEPALIIFPYNVPAEYDVSMTFIPTNSKDEGGRGVSTGIFARHGGVRFQCVVSPEGVGIGRIDGKNPLQNRSSQHLSSLPFHDGQANTMTLRVRNDRIEAVVNGKLILAFKTDWNDIKPPVGATRFVKGDSLGICPTNQSFVLTSATLVDRTK